MTKRNVSARLSEHVYRNLCLKGGKVFIYSVFWFMLNSAYKCNAFEIVNKQSILISPCYAETITIKPSSPDLHVQKDSIDLISACGIVDGVP